MITPVSNTHLTTTTSTAPMSESEAMSLHLSGLGDAYNTDLNPNGPAAKKIEAAQERLAEHRQELRKIEKQLADPQTRPSAAELPRLEFKVAALHQMIKNTQNEITEGHIAQYQEQIDTIDAKVALYHRAPEWLQPHVIPPHAMGDLARLRTTALSHQDYYRQLIR